MVYRWCFRSFDLCLMPFCPKPSGVYDVGRRRIGRRSCVLGCVVFGWLVPGPLCPLAKMEVEQSGNGYTLYIAWLNSIVFQQPFSTKFVDESESFMLWLCPQWYNVSTFCWEHWQIKLLHWFKYQCSRLYVINYRNSEASNQLDDEWTSDMDYGA